MFGCLPAWTSVRLTAGFAMLPLTILLEKLERDLNVYVT